MLDRALHGAAMPVANATVSYWMDAPPYPEVNLNQKRLPDIADYVIIGTGLTGLAATRTVLEISQDQRTEMPLRVVALEARDVCAGATGRNGGHVKVKPYKQFAALKEALGGSEARARDTLMFMERHVDMLKEVGKEVPQGEVRDVEAVDMFLEQADFEKAKGLVDDLKTSVPEIEVNVWPGQEAREKVRFPYTLRACILYTNCISLDPTTPLQAPSRTLLAPRSPSASSRALGRRSSTSIPSSCSSATRPSRASPSPRTHPSTPTPSRHPKAPSARAMSCTLPTGTRRTSSRVCVAVSPAAAAA